MAPLLRQKISLADWALKTGWEDWRRALKANQVTVTEWEEAHARRTYATQAEYKVWGEKASEDYNSPEEEQAADDRVNEKLAQDTSEKREIETYLIDLHEKARIAVIEAEAELARLDQGADDEERAVLEEKLRLLKAEEQERLASKQNLNRRVEALHQRFEEEEKRLTRIDVLHKQIDKLEEEHEKEQGRLEGLIARRGQVQLEADYEKLDKQVKETTAVIEDLKKRLTSENPSRIEKLELMYEIGRQTHLVKDQELRRAMNEASIAGDSQKGTELQQELLEAKTQRLTEIQEAQVTLRQELAAGQSQGAEPYSNEERWRAQALLYSYQSEQSVVWTARQLLDASINGQDVSALTSALQHVEADAAQVRRQCVRLIQLEGAILQGGGAEDAKRLRLRQEYFLLASELQYGLNVYEVRKLQMQLGQPQLSDEQRRTLGSAMGVIMTQQQSLTHNSIQTAKTYERELAKETMALRSRWLNERENLSNEEQQTLLIEFAASSLQLQAAQDQHRALTNRANALAASDQQAMRYLQQEAERLRLRSNERYETYCRTKDRVDKTVSLRERIRNENDDRKRQDMQLEFDEVFVKLMANMDRWLQKRVGELEQTLGRHGLPELQQQEIRNEASLTKAFKESSAKWDELKTSLEPRKEQLRLRDMEERLATQKEQSKGGELSDKGKELDARINILKANVRLREKLPEAEIKTLQEQVRVAERELQKLASAHVSPQAKLEQIQMELTNSEEELAKLEGPLELRRRELWKEELLTQMEDEAHKLEGRNQWRAELNTSVTNLRIELEKFEQGQGESSPSAGILNLRNEISELADALQQLGEGEQRFSDLINTMKDELSQLNDFENVPKITELTQLWQNSEIEINPDMQLMEAQAKFSRLAKDLELRGKLQAHGVTVEKWQSDLKQTADGYSGDDQALKSRLTKLIGEVGGDKSVTEAWVKEAQSELSPERQKDLERYLNEVALNRGKDVSRLVADVSKAEQVVAFKKEWGLIGDIASEYVAKMEASELEALSSDLRRMYPNGGKVAFVRLKNDESLQAYTLSDRPVDLDRKEVLAVATKKPMSGRATDLSATVFVMGEIDAIRVGLKKGSVQTVAQRQSSPEAGNAITPESNESGAKVTRKTSIGKFK